MSSWLSRRARGWGLSAIVGAVVLAIALAAGSFQPAVPWRFFRAAHDREEARAVERGKSYLQKDLPRRAIQAVAGIPEGSPSEGEALTIRGLALARMEEVGPARQVLERAWRVRHDPMAAKVLAGIYLGAYETERGLLMLQAAAQLDPGDFRPWYAMGEGVYLRLRRYDEAADAFRQALKRRPDHVESRIGLVDALIKAHRPEEAEPLLHVLLHDRPDDLKVLIPAVELAWELGRLPQATQYLEHALTLDPDHRDARLFRARLKCRLGRSGVAGADAERAAAADPNDLAGLNLLGSIQKALGLEEQAARTLAHRREVEHRTTVMEGLIQQIDARPRDPEPRWRLGRVAREAGLKPLAIQSYQAALALAPDCQPARQGLAELGIRPSQSPRTPTPARAGTVR